MSTVSRDIELNKIKIKNPEEWNSAKPEQFISNDFVDSNTMGIAVLARKTIGRKSTKSVASQATNKSN